MFDTAKDKEIEVGALVRGLPGAQSIRDRMLRPLLGLELWVGPR